MGMTADELGERMSAAEFNRHLEDQLDFPDDMARVAHSCHVISTLLNKLVHGMSEGKFSLDQSVLAPWLYREKERDRERELTQEEADRQYDAWLEGVKRIQAQQQKKAGHE
jgi:hypothetical protein